MSLILNGTDGVTFNDGSNQPAAASPFTFKNYLINGNFDFWQRGTTATITTSGIAAADRWQYITDGTLNTGSVFTQQTFTVGQTDVPNNPTYFLQAVYTSVNTPSNYIRQRIENVSTLSGQSVTFSFWARVTSGTLSTSAQFQQEFGSGGSPSSGVYGIGSTSYTFTTAWQKFTLTTTLPSISGKTIGTNNNSALNAAIAFPASGSATVQIAQVQVERGSNATQFEYRPLQMELALCQRYFYRGSLYGAGCSGGSTSQFIALKYPTTMRANPTVAWVSSGRIGNGITDTAVTGLSALIGTGTDSASATFTTGVFGAGGQGIILYDQPIITLNAEL